MECKVVLATAAAAAAAAPTTTSAAAAAASRGLLDFLFRIVFLVLLSLFCGRLTLISIPSSSLSFLPILPVRAREMVP